jgi:hypothetical protein
MAIENAKRLTRESSYASPAIERFQKEQSLSARVKRQRVSSRAANDNEITVANDDFFDEPQEGKNAGERISRDVSAPRAARRALLGVELWIAASCSFFQFFFGLIAIVFICAGFYDGFLGFSGDDIANFAGSTVGEAVVGTVNFVGGFFGFQIALPPITFTGIGLVCWGITLIFTVAGYGVIALLFKIQGIDVFESEEAFLLTVSAIALDVILVGQLFPWMIVWVMTIAAAPLLFNKH